MKNITRLFDFPYFQLANFAIDDALATKVNGEWEKISTQIYVNKANCISRGLIYVGVQKNDKIAIISSNNRTEWHIMDIGILQVGAQNVPIYPTISSNEYEYILNHSEAKYCIVSDNEILQKLNSIRNKLPKLLEVYSFDVLENCKNWSELLKIGETANNQDEVEQRKKNVKPNELATIIYTSGTTGKPKGVMLSHNNIVSNVLDCSDRIPFKNGEGRAISFLPICHIYERMVTYIYQFTGTAIYFGESLDKVSENIKEIQPTVMTGVPRLIEKIYEKILAKGSELKGIKRWLFFWAVDLGLRYEPSGNSWWYDFQLTIARKLIFKKWKMALGGRLELVVNGASKLQPQLARVFAASQMAVMEGYGLTETSPVVSVNDQREGGFKIGTAGKVIKNVKVKIASDGEILCKGPNIMMGYYKDQTLTDEVIIDGYFHTGDIGKLDEKGFLTITDRKKEMFKTSGGKYIAPQLLENEIKQSRFIEQIMVVGEGEKMPAAFIQPNFEFVKEWATLHNVEIGTSLYDICNNESVIARVKIEIDSINLKFGSWEKVKSFKLTPETWSTESGHLTPTMKLKRKFVLERYVDFYNKIYNK
ncbi:AMP-dependent synthetase [Chryseobacterium sp. CBo1]|uniref:AMP-dependent synthetase/ligase n=1 Tax=Chryseobacterium sp. CBo1 TaxID=1869230 RepID=UPI0008109528|nr:long-chain fatty acid--CoA ligase [Chryseobacterium sp. CBo1]OCK53072.1 AMP-dependent synthetase [Chryseobacterium sp. CBo1]